jgi:PAS domain S-box-containing protein
VTEDLPNLYELIFREVPIGILALRLVDWDDLGSLTLVAANAAHSAVTGTDLTPYVGQRIDSFAPAAMSTDRPRRYAEVVRTGRPADLGESYLPPGFIQGASGRWLHITAFPLGGDLVGVSSEDVTSKKQSELALLNRDRFLESILENLPDMIFVKDAQELRFVRFNKAGEDLLGFSRSDLLGKNDYDFFPREQADAFTAKDREVLAGGTVVDIPWEPLNTKYKGTRTLHTKKIPILDEAGNPQYLLGISEDITALARSAAALARSNAELEHFAHVASHDLQEPLRKIQAFGGLLRESSAGVLSAEANGYLDRMLNAAARMRSLVTDLLALARVTSEARPFVAVDLAEIVRDVLGDLEARVYDSGARVEVGTLPVVLADPLQMRQLAQNLIGNALKFHAPGRPPVVRIHGSDGETPELVVEDEGIGFEQRFVDRIFKPFQRLEARSSYEGTGIGLAICEKIVARHGGTLKARSVPGAGSTFTATFPNRPPDEP